MKLDLIKNKVINYKVDHCHYWILINYCRVPGWGRIVNTSSQMGLISTPGKTPYSAVKAALIGLTKVHQRSPPKVLQRKSRSEI